jgi:PAS domain S-box-containing protein
MTDTSDIDDRQSVEQNTVDDYAHLVEQAEDGLYMIGKNGAFELVNEAFQELTGYERSQLVGSDPRLIMDDDDFQQFNERVRTTLYSESESGSMLTTVVTQSGQRKPVEVRFSLLDGDEDGYDGVVGVARDIRARRHREQKLNVLGRVLRHNIRNKLNLISGHASIIEASGGTQFDHAASQITDAAEELLELSEKARTAQSEVGFDPSGTGQTDLVEISQHLAVTFRREYPETKLRTDLPTELSADIPTSYRIAVSELVENAIEHNPSPEPVVELHLERTNGEIRTTIDDHCPPISDSEVQAINEGRETPLVHSLGIGLWLANWVADTIGGTLELKRREDDSGNRATLRLYE